MKEKFVITIISHVSIQIVSIIASYLLLLVLDIELIGLIALISSIVNLGFLVSDIGISSIHYQYSGEENYDEYYGTFFTIKMILLCLNLLLILFIFTLFNVWISQYLPFFLIQVLTNVLIQLKNVFSINLRTKLKVFKVEITNFVISIGRCLSTIYLALNISRIADPLLYLFLVGLIFNFLFVVFILFLAKNEFKINKFNKNLARRYITDAKPLILVSILTIIASNIGNIILDYSFGHESLAYFTIVNNNIIMVLLLISVSLNGIFLSLYSQYFQKNQLSQIINITHKVEKFSSMLFLSIILIVFLNGELFFLVLLPKYLNSLPILLILIFIPYLAAISRPYEYHLIPGRKQKILSYWKTINLFLQIILMLILIPSTFFFFKMMGLGTTGYALAILIPFIIEAILYRYFSYKYFNIASQKSIFYHILIAIASFIIMLFVKNYILTSIIKNNLLLLITSSLICVGIFFGLLYLFKILKNEDIRYLLELLKVGTYKRSLLDEFSK